MSRAVRRALSCEALFYRASAQERIISINHRPLYEIAAEIKKTWPKVYLGAVPYLQAMESLNLITDEYGCDSASSIVLYFLSNATTWKGEDTRRIKAELKKIVNLK